MQSLKKVFSSFVSMTTILWSVGGTLAFPSVASAATMNSGDLVKASGPAVYYYAADGKRYVFPNEKTYFSWYSNFSTVKTITDAELAAITIGGNVTYRPGVKMVKITTDPKTYAVAKGGILRHIPSEACATTLYGSAWNTMIDDVPDGFFVNYTVGAAINSSCSDFDKTAEMNSAPTINDNLGSVPVSGSVAVSLASDSPAGVTVPKNAASVSMLKVNLSAGSNAALVTGLNLRRIGVGATTDFSNVYLYDANGTRITTGRTINSSSNIVQFNGLNISIPANTTVSLVLTGDFSTPSTTGGQHAFEVSDAASLVLSGSGTVSGSFPVRGNTFTVGTTAAAELDVLKGTTPSNPNIGAADVEVSNFKLVANTNDIEVRRITLLQAGDISNTDLTNFKLYQGSTLVATAASVVGDKIVLNFNPPYVIEDGQTRTFALKATVGGRAGRTIKTYVEYTTDVYAIDRLYNSGAAIDIDDTNGFDGNSTNSTFITVTTQGGQLTIAYNGPAAANVGKGSQDVKLYNFALSAESDLELRKLRFRIDSTTGGQLEESTTDYFTDIKVIDADTGAILMGPTSLAASSASGTSFILTDTFYLTAGKTRNLSITADLANSTDADFVGEKYRVCLGDGTQSAIAAGTALSTTCDAEAIFQEGDIKIVSTGENLATSKMVPNTAISGNEMTVQNSSLSVSLASSPSATTYVKKQANIDATGFVFTAGTESTVRVTAVTLTGTGDITTDSTYAITELNDVVTSCAIFDGTTQVGTSQTPDGTLGTMTFSGLTLDIPAGSSKTLVVKCTADSTVAGSLDHFAIGIASGNVTSQDADGNEITETLSAGVIANAATSGQTVIQTVRNSGTISVTAGSQPQATIVVGGASKKFAEFTATAQYENVTIDRLTVTSTGQAANFTGISVRVAGADKGTDILATGADQYKDVVLSSPITVPKDGSVTFEIWGTMAGVVASSTVSGSTSAPRSGNSSELGLAVGVTASPWDAAYTTSIFNVMALGSASGERLYAAGSATTGNSGNGMVLRKTKPTITKLAVATNSLTSGNSTEIYKFQVTPDAAGAVSWKQVTFTVSTSSGVTLDNFQLFKGSTQLVANTEVRILDSNGTDITGGSDLGSGNTVVVYLVSEEVVSGSGTVYTLRATPTYSGSSATVSTAFTRSTADATGYLANPAGTVAFGIDNSGAAADGTADVTSRFIWSDNSEVPHGFATGTGSSRDWTNDFYVEDMTQTQTLTQ